MKCDRPTSPSDDMIETAYWLATVPSLAIVLAVFLVLNVG